MLLGFDIGNTNTLMGVYNRESAVPFAMHRFVTEKSSSAKKLAPVIEKFLDECSITRRDIRGVAVTSVVPEVVDGYSVMAKQLFHADLLSIDHTLELNISIDYDDPSSLGPDRITNAAAAFHEHGGSIIIDIGTAITLCVVKSDGHFAGGLITAGPGTAMKALAAAASRLPEVKIQRPERLIAGNTVAAIQSGIYFGWCALINGLLNAAAAETGGGLKRIITGGFSELLSRDLECDLIDPLLTMKGIKYIHDMNRH